MPPRYPINHSGALNPRTHTPLKGSTPVRIMDLAAAAISL